MHDTGAAPATRLPRDDHRAAGLLVLLNHGGRQAVSCQAGGTLPAVVPGRRRTDLDPGMMTYMAEPFHLRTSDGCEWTMHPPVDPYGDGYIRTADVGIRADGVSACTAATLSVEPGGIDLARFFAGLAADWRGWDGKRRWQALEREMEIEAWHDGRAHVMLAVTLMRPERTYADDAWSARVVFTVEAGEELATLAKEIISLLET